MNKFNKYLTFNIIFLIGLQISYGQEQNNFCDDLSMKFLKYCEDVPREEIYIHTDRTDYIAGEELWFNIYLIDRQRGHPSNISRIAYFEILNSDNRPVVQKRILTENGIGPGQITLPDTLSTGCYSMRAYTNWMKNFLTFNCFVKQINIYNVASDHTVNTGTDNKGTDYISDSLNNDFLKDVMGLQVNINDLRPDSLILSIDSDENYRSENHNLCYLFIQTHGQINIIRSVNLHSGNLRLALSKAILIPGINQITIFDYREQPVTEKFIYTPLSQANYLTANTNDSCNIRDSISIDLELSKEIIKNSYGSNISISVTPVSENGVNSDLRDYMVFGTEFGPIPDEIRNSRLDELSPEILKGFLSGLKSNWIDWKYILQGKVPEIKHYIENKEHYIAGSLSYSNSPKNNAGKYLFLSSPGKIATFQYARTDSTGNFCFSIPISADRKDLIIQPEDATGSPAIRISSSFSEYYPPSENIQVEANRPVSNRFSMLSVNYQVSRIYGLTSTGSPLPSSLPLAKQIRFYGKPDIELIMDDYVRLPVMEEVFFELTPGIQLKNKNSVQRITIANPFDNKIYEEPPVLLVDGVVINDPSVIGNLDPGIVEKIDAFRNMYIVGDYHFYGLVNVITRAGDYSSIRLPDYAVRLRYMVIDPVKSFCSPEYSSAEKKQSRIPDFRNTLYWNPSVKPRADGKARVQFWSSDQQGEYEVNIQGITGDGKAVSLKKLIKVK